MAWTEMQNQAIHKRGTNCIVSAGAGSGKTAVLSERILKYCLDGKDICSFLVLTFTNAAALEMKERIRKKLIEHNLRDQASKIDSAFITTFDAYSLALVKKYYFYLNVDKDITIMDEALLEVKKKEILDQIFEEQYNQKNLTFFSFLKKYTKQNDENVKKMILSILSKLELIVDEEDFCKKYEQTYYDETFLLKLISQYEKLALENAWEFYKELQKLIDLSFTDSASQKLYAECKELLSKANLKTYDEAYIWVNTLVLPRVNPKTLDFIKMQKTIVSDKLKDLKTKYFSKYSNLEEAKKELYAIKEDVLYLLNLTLELKHRLDAYKYDLMAFDYMDIAKLAIRLIKENPNVLKEIKTSFTEILIDEYQDTSDIQETFVSYIANQNCYMVGDLKQSIYRFRNANPYIFKNKYLKYSNLEDGIKIDLTHNFRSRKEVIEDINLIFSNLMTLEIGDADYAQDHMMRYGQMEYEKNLDSINYHMDILTYDATSEFSDEEVEAFICGYKIKELMNQNLSCLKKDGFQPLKYSDFAILMDKSKGFILFKKVFEYLGIPLAIEADIDLNDSILPKLFSNIFLCIVQFLEQDLNKSYQHALVSIGRSFLFEYTDEELYLMVKKYKENELTNIIRTLAGEAQDLSLEELYFKIVENFKIYEKLSLIGDVENSCEVLEYIYTLFKTMASAGMNIKEACGYFSSIFENEIDLKYKMSEDSKNCVHMMTIHKSKGLEFPYCIFPMLGSKFNQSDIKDNFGLSTTYGIYIPFFDETSSNTIIKSLVEEDLRRADLSEKIRLFYVALTRAREKIIFVSKNLDIDEPIQIHRVSSFNQLLYTKQFFKEYHKPIDLDKIGLTHKYHVIKHSIKTLSKKPISYSNDTYRSVSEDKKGISKELVELMDSSLKQAIELGKKFHECLEVLDFNHINIEDLPIDSFMKQALHKVLATPVFKNINQAKAYHEHEFYYGSYHGIIDLLCVYEDHIDIIDYKLSNTSSEEYLRQLSVYKGYVEQHSSLPVSCYLLSILKQEVKKVL